MIEEHPTHGSLKHSSHACFCGWLPTIFLSLSTYYPSLIQWRPCPLIHCSDGYRGQGGEPDTAPPPRDLQFVWGADR